MRLPQALTGLVSKPLEEKLGAEAYKDLRNWLQAMYQDVQRVVNGNLQTEDNFGHEVSVIYNPAVAGNAQEFGHDLGRTPTWIFFRVNDVLVGDWTGWWTDADAALWTNSLFRFRGSQKGLTINCLLV